MGLTLSIRILAPLAGGLVLVYMLWKIGKRAVYPAIVYLGLAWVTTYLTWPYLWGAPIKHLIKSWQVMNAFADPGPWYSLPSLLVTQYTETAVILSAVGLVIAGLEFIRGKRSGLLFLVVGWTLLPLGYLVVKRSSCTTTSVRSFLSFRPFL